MNETQWYKSMKKFATSKRSEVRVWNLEFMFFVNKAFIWNNFFSKIYISLLIKSSLASLTYHQLDPGCRNALAILLVDWWHPLPLQRQYLLGRQSPETEGDVLQTLVKGESFAFNVLVNYLPHHQLPMYQWLHWLHKEWEDHPLLRQSSRWKGYEVRCVQGGTGRQPCDEHRQPHAWEW